MTETSSIRPQEPPQRPSQTKAPRYIFAKVAGDAKADELEAVASTGALDRDSEIIEPAAWRASLEAFRANPVILATHQHRLMTGSSPVIGSAVSIDAGDDGLRFRMRFASTALGQEYAALYRETHMRAFSVGFIPVNGEWREFNRADHGQGARATSKRVWVHTEVELLEISAVPVPANPEALARMRAAAAAGVADSEALIRDIAAEVMLRLAEFDLPAKLVKAAASEIRNLKSEILDRLDEAVELFARSSDTLGAFDAPSGSGAPPAGERAPGGDGGDGADELKKAAARHKRAARG